MRRAQLGLSISLVVVLVAGLVAISSGRAPASPVVFTPIDEHAQVPEPVAPVNEPATAPAPDTTDPPPPPAPAPPPPALAAQLAALVQDPALAGRHVTVSVTDGSGTPIFGWAEDVPSIPASTQKMLVAAAALATLGPDFRYETWLRATQPVGADGVLAGSLVLVGSGDPSLATPTYGSIRHDRPRTPLELLADQVVAAGVTRVAGAVIGDPTVFPDQPVPEGWLPRYFTEGDATLVLGLTAEGGRRLFHRGGRVQSLPSDDPALDAAGALVGLLAERGITVDGGPASTRTPVDAPVSLGSVVSHPLRDLLRHVVQRSDNQMADAIYRTIGLARGDASWTGAATATRGALTPMGLDLHGTALADGSGLSRLNRVPAGLLTSLDVAMHRSNLAGEWHALLAVAGENGTLQRRLPGTLAETRLRGKTGSLRDVRALSGVVVGPEGSRYHFAVMGNGLDRAGNVALRWLQDGVVMALLGDLYGCTALLPPAPPAAAGPNAYACSA